MATIAELFALASRYHQHRQLEQAELLYRQILQADSSHAETHHQLGILAHQSGHPQAASVHISQAIALKPNTSDYHYSLGIVNKDQGHFTEARNCYRQALLLNPNYLEAHYNLGLLYFEQGQISLAVESLRHALRINPNDAHVQNSLGSILAGQRQLAEAAECFRHALRVNPNFPEAHSNMGANLQDQGHSVEAYSHLQQAIRLRPGLVDAHYNLGNVLRDIGQHENAIVSYREALRLRPDSFQAHTNLGTTLVALQRLDEACSCFQQAARLKPDWGDVHKNLGISYQRLGRFEEAAACFQRALDLQPEDHVSGFMLAAVTGKEPPRTAPRQFVADLFDHYAGHFDEHLLKKLNYRGPLLLREAIPDMPETQALDILDLGCGTGLCGLAFQGLARTLTGVDLSAQMLAQARCRGIYQHLIQGDIHETLQPMEAAFDLILAGDVFAYLGDLAAVFPAVRKAMRPGSRFAFQVEAYDGESWLLQPSGRFAHSVGYIRQMARATGLAEVSLKKEVLRTENGKNVEGNVFVLKRED